MPADLASSFVQDALLRVHSVTLALLVASELLCRELRCVATSGIRTTLYLQAQLPHRLRCTLAARSVAKP